MVAFGLDKYIYKPNTFEISPTTNSSSKFSSSGTRYSDSKQRAKHVDICISTNSSPQMSFFRNPETTHQRNDKLACAPSSAVRVTMLGRCRVAPCNGYPETNHCMISPPNRAVAVSALGILLCPFSRLSKSPRGARSKLYTFSSRHLVVVLQKGLKLMLVLNVDCVDEPYNQVEDGTKTRMHVTVSNAAGFRAVIITRGAIGASTFGSECV